MFGSTDPCHGDSQLLSAIQYVVHGCAYWFNYYLFLVVVWYTCSLHQRMWSNTAVSHDNTHTHTHARTCPLFTHKRQLIVLPESTVHLYDCFRIWFKVEKESEDLLWPVDVAYFLSETAHCCVVLSGLAPSPSNRLCATPTKNQSFKLSLS